MHRFIVTEIADDGSIMGDLQFSALDQLDCVRRYNAFCIEQGVRPVRVSVSADGDQTIGVPECNCGAESDRYHWSSCPVRAIELAQPSPGFQLPETLTLEVIGESWDSESQSYLIPEARYEIPELMAEFGPKFCGSGHHQETNGVIRTQMDARILAMEVIKRWNAYKPTI